MNWVINVPKIFHVYWGGGTMPYMRMLTVKSFLKHNPDWQVNLWMPTQKSILRTWDSRELNYPIQCEDCTPEILIPSVERREVDFRQFGMSNNISEVHKSDFLRLELLATIGGVWSDMDIIYFKPITELAVNIPANNDKEAFVCIGHYGHSAGFLMSAPNSQYFKRLTELAKQHINPKEYQGIGATMFNNYYRNISDIQRQYKVANIDMDAVYAHDAMKISDILDGTPQRFTNKSIGIHWYAGHPMWGSFIKNTNGGKTDIPESVIGNVLKMFM